MTEEQFKSIGVGDTCKGMSWGRMLTGIVIIKDDDSVLLMCREASRRMSLSTCAYERLELVDRSPLSAIREALGSMRPSLETLLELTESE